MLSELYGHFAEQFPQYETFWNTLSREEDRHAKLLQNLLEAAKGSKIRFDEGGIKTYTVNQYVRKYT